MSESPRRRRSPWPWIAGCIVLMAAGLLCAILFRRARHEREVKEVLADLDRDDPGWKLKDIEAAREQIPEGENSARLIVVVHKLLPRNWYNDELFKATKGLAPPEQLSAEAHELLRAELAKLDPALQVARGLADRPRGRHRLVLEKNPLMTLLEDQQNTRSAAALLRFDALLRAQEGDLGGALVSCRGALNAGRSLGDEPIMVSQLIRMACVEVAVGAAERVLAQGEPPADELKALQELLGDEAKHRGFAVAIRGERGGMSDVFAALKSGDISTRELASLGTGGPDGGDWWKYNLFAEDVHVEQARVLRLLTRLVESSRLPHHEQAEAEAEIEAEVSALPSGAVLTRLLLPATSKVAQADRRRVARVRSLLAALACERYRQAEGKWPAKLGDLVPKYLPEVPADPDDGKELRLAHTPEGLVIYSVGPDGTDDGGKLNRRNPIAKGSDLGIQLWNPDQRRQPPPEPKGDAPEEMP